MRNTECSSKKALGYSCAAAAGVAAFCGGPVGWTIATICFLAGAGNLYIANDENKKTLKYS